MFDVGLKTERLKYKDDLTKYNINNVFSSLKIYLSSDMVWYVLHNIIKQNFKVTKPLNRIHKVKRFCFSL